MSQGKFSGDEIRPPHFSLFIYLIVLVVHKGNRVPWDSKDSCLVQLLCRTVSFFPLFETSSSRNAVLSMIVEAE